LSVRAVSNPWTSTKAWMKDFEMLVPLPITAIKKGKQINNYNQG